MMGDTIQQDAKQLASQFEAHVSKEGMASLLGVCHALLNRNGVPHGTLDGRITNLLNRIADPWTRIVEGDDGTLPPKSEPDYGAVSISILVSYGDTGNEDIMIAFYDFVAENWYDDEGYVTTIRPHAWQPLPAAAPYNGGGG